MKSNENNNVSFKELFLSFLKINFFTFGGGYTIVPVIRDEFVRNKKLIEEDTMLDIVAIAQSGPGPMAINTSILTGYKLKGWKGALICLLASITPCIIIISIMYYIYSWFNKIPWIKAGLECMSGAISAVLLITVYQMGKNAILKHKIIGSILFILSFIFGYFLKVNAIYIIISSGIIGYVYFSFLGGKKPC